MRAYKQPGKVLPELEELFQKVFIDLPVGAFVVQKRMFRLFNPRFQRVVGYSRDQLLAMNCLELVLPEDRNLVRENAVKWLKGKGLLPYEYRFVNKDGSIGWAMETVISGQYRGQRAALGYFVDITERKQAEDREKKLQQQLNLTSRLASICEMAAGIAHEINNPLTGVIGFAQMLAKMDVPEDIKEAVEVINDGARRVSGIVEKMLTFARRNGPDKEYVDINAIIASTVEMRSYEMRNNNIEVITRLASDLPWTMANIGQLQQVFLNIIINAEQAMTSAGGKGKLSIKTDKLGNSIRVAIADDGPGITRDNIDKLFDPFFTTKDADGGTGLGLSISYSIINEHGGKVYAESALGEGATFVVELPIIAETKQPKVAEPSGKEPEKVTGARIMVVDDEPYICQVLDRLLTQEGHRVEAISNAQTALQRLNTAKYDLILLDIKMPGMDGIEFYNHMKGITPPLQRKVVCITGDVISVRNKAFLDEARIPYIAKPFSIDELIRQVKSVLECETNNAQIRYSYR